MLLDKGKLILANLALAKNVKYKGKVSGMLQTGLPNDQNLQSYNLYSTGHRMQHKS